MTEEHPGRNGLELTYSGSEVEEVVAGKAHHPLARLGAVNDGVAALLKRVPEPWRLQDQQDGQANELYPEALAGEGRGPITLGSGRKRGELLSSTPADRTSLQKCGWCPTRRDPAWWREITSTRGATHPEVSRRILIYEMLDTHLLR